jgi:hypothetical protein
MHDAADAKEASGVLWIYYGAAAGQGSNLVSTIAPLQPNWARRLYLARSQIIWLVAPREGLLRFFGCGLHARALRTRAVGYDLRRHVSQAVVVHQPRGHVGDERRRAGGRRISDLRRSQKHSKISVASLDTSP